MGKYKDIAEGLVDYIFAATAAESLLKGLRSYTLVRPFDDVNEVLPRLSDQVRKEIKKEFKEQKEIIVTILKTAFPLQDPILIREKLIALNDNINEFIEPIKEAFIRQFETDFFKKISKIIDSYAADKSLLVSMLGNWKKNLISTEMKRDSLFQEEEDKLLSIITKAYTFRLMSEATQDISFPIDRESIGLILHQRLNKLLLPAITNKQQVNYYSLFLQAIQEDFQKQHSNISITYLVELQQIIGKLAVEQFFEWLSKDYHYDLYAFPNLFKSQPKSKPLHTMQQTIFTGLLSFADKHKFNGNVEVNSELKQDFLKKLIANSKEGSPKFSKVVEKKLRVEKLKEKKLKGKRLKEEKPHKEKVKEEKRLFHKRSHGFLFKSAQSKCAQKKKPPSPFMRQHRSEENLNRFQCARPNRCSVSLPSDCLEVSVELKLNK